jgi:hypothetical protein
MQYANFGLRPATGLIFLKVSQHSKSYCETKQPAIEIFMLPSIS